ncbi:hypothetical protein AOE01nite_08320 [Acetobacter oeni]|uniref:Uncharacterized protein n=1 Tax=Acetobacter oeni TaxID=304077 RepID=A0A511XI34_9PROT|nr:hypothetical protein AOE01nite_08320 [Acetobacter oeni]
MTPGQQMESIAYPPRSLKTAVRRKVKVTQAPVLSDRRDGSTQPLSPPGNPGHPEFGQTAVRVEMGDHTETGERPCVSCLCDGK